MPTSQVVERRYRSPVAAGLDPLSSRSSARNRARGRTRVPGSPRSGTPSRNCPSRRLICPSCGPVGRRRTGSPRSAIPSFMQHRVSTTSRRRHPCWRWRSTAMLGPIPSMSWSGTRSSMTPSVVFRWRCSTARCATPQRLLTGALRVAFSSSECPDCSTTPVW